MVIESGLKDQSKLNIDTRNGTRM